MKPDLEQLSHQFKRCFSTAEGKAVLQELARYCHIGFPVSPQSDPTTTYGIACMQNVFWHVYHHVHSNRKPTAKAAPPVDFDVFAATTPHLRSAG